MADPWYRYPKGLRQRILARDEYHCRINLPPQPDPKTGQLTPVCRHTPDCYRCATVIDHIIPALSGGAWFDPGNLRAACSPCNQHRRNHSGPLPQQPPPQRTYHEPW